MSEGLNGTPDSILYQYHFVGGPKDGEVGNGFRPYFRLVTSQGCVYETLNQDDFVEWLDDGTRKIELHFKELTEPPIIENYFFESLKKPKKIDISEPDKVRRFFDPHPGLMGCTIRIPESVKIVANKLDGVQKTLKEAVNLIQEACPQGIVEAYENHRMIVLSLNDPDGGVNSWRVIRFE